MTCVNNNSTEKSNILTTTLDITPNYRIYNIPKGIEKSQDDIKLFFYNKNFDVYKDIINNTYPNTYKIKLLNEFNEINNNSISDKNKYGSKIIHEPKEKRCIIENEDYYEGLLKNSKKKTLEKQKLSISGKIYENEYYKEKGKNKKRIIKGKYVEILPEKKDHIRAKLVKLHYSSKKSTINDKYDFYGDNCSFLSRDIENTDDFIYQERELVSEAKKKSNHVFKNSSNNILFLNTSLYKKKINNINENENPSMLKVDELDVNKTENKSWKQNILQKQLETLNETNDKTQFYGYRRAESDENIEKNDIKTREVLSYVDDLFEDEKITIFKNIHNEPLNDEYCKDLESNDNIEMKSREIKDIFDNNDESIEIKSREIRDSVGSNPFNYESFSSVPYKEYMAKRPSLSHHLYHYKQSKEIFNYTNKPIDRRSLSVTPNSKKDQIRSNKNSALKNIDIDNDNEEDNNSEDEFLVNLDLHKNLLMYKNFSLKNYSEDCLDKMLMNYPDNIHRKNLRFNLNENNPEEPVIRKTESPVQSTPQTPETTTTRKDSKGKLQKIGKKLSNSSISTLDSNGNDSKKALRKNSNNSTPNNNNDQKRKKDENLNPNLNPNPNPNPSGFNFLATLKKKKKGDIPVAEPIKTRIIDIDLIRPVKEKEILDLIERNNCLPFNVKLHSFKLFQVEINQLIKKLDELKEQKDKDEINEKQNKKDLELIELLKKLYEEHQHEAVVIQEQEMSKKGGKKAKMVPTTDDKKTLGTSNAVNNKDNAAVNASKQGLSINSIFHISVLVSNIRNQVRTGSNVPNKVKKSNESINSSVQDEMQTIKEEEDIDEFKNKLEEIKKELKLNEENLKILKQYENNLKEKLRTKIKRNILKYEVKNIKKYYKKKDTINIFNMLSKPNINKIENKQPLKSISHAGSLMDIKTFNKVDKSLLHSFNKSSYHNRDYQIKNITNEDFDDESNIKSLSTNNSITNENKIINSSLYKVFCKSHPSKFKNPIEQVKTVSDVTLPTIADYKNKLYYHNNKSIDINKKDTNSKFGK